MPRSMTGFGKATCELNGDVVTAELSAVNHRYLDCSVKLPLAWQALESVVKQTVRAHISRGKIYVVISRKRSGTSNTRVQLDTELAKRYVEASRQLGQLMGGSFETLSIDVLAQLEGVFVAEENEEDLETIGEGVAELLKEGLNKLDSMRCTEGKALEDDLCARVAAMRVTLATIEERLPQLNELYEKRLRLRIDELKDSIGIAEDRIAMEVALLADKSDVTEEVVRLKTHFDHMLELFGSKDAVGRQLDFLSQEMLREVNTLGVKTRDADVAKDVIRMKSELEKIREQIQNIE